MTWAPLERVPDALHLAFCDAVRVSILHRDIGRGIARDADGLLVVPIESGGVARVGFEKRSEVPASFGPRQAIRVTLDGRAVVGRAGYGLAATALVDVKSRSFVSVTCEILWRDEDAPPRG